MLHGSSINAEYQFEKHDKINHHFLFGKLSKPNISKLSVGSIKTIYSGDRFIHSVFHLDNPTISIVVRTHQDDDAMPQFEYRGSHICLVKEISPELTKQIQALKFVFSTDKDDFVKYFTKIYLTAPLDEKYWLIRALYTNLCKIPALWQMINQNNNQKTQWIIESVSEEAILSKVINIRTKIQDVELRYFIALLMNIPKWDEVTEFVKKYYENEPEKMIERCFSKLQSLGYQLPEINKITFDIKNEMPDVITEENALSKIIIKKLYN